MRAFSRPSPQLCVLIIGLFVAHTLCAEGAFRLREREGGREHTVRMSIEYADSGAVFIVHSSSGDRQTIRVDASWAARQMQFASPESRSDFEAVRDGDSIRLRGTLNGKPVDRVLEIDASPWFALVELSLPGWVIGGGAKRISFWVLDSAQGGAHRIAAERMGRERITIAGADVEAVKVKLTVPGVPAFLWSSPWWFRASDGAFLRYEMARGIPGTPKTVLELIAEE